MLPSSALSMSRPLPVELALQAKVLVKTTDRLAVSSVNSTMQPVDPNLNQSVSGDLIGLPSPAVMRRMPT